jgi:lipoprotein LprG
VVACLAGAVLAACGGGTHKVPAPELLQKAKATADAASAVHFVITGQNVSHKGTNLIGGSGDLVRPDSLSGSFNVTVSDLSASIKVASVGGVFEAELPFSAHYQKADPASLGLTDPAQLLNPQTGLTKLLTLAHDPVLGPDQRVGGELLETVTFDVPGSAVPVLPDLDPSTPVTLTVAVDPSNYQLRSVTLVGPFTDAKSNTTYVVTLSAYDEHVTVTLPPAS